MQYGFEHGWKYERQRLAALEGSLDDYSIACLIRIGVAPGWHCLELGAGAGSIARWLSDQVGPEGKVVATDLEVEFLNSAPRPNLEIRRHDVQQDPLEEDAYDLVHARKLLEHLPDPRKILERAVASAHSGGWVLVEDADLRSTLQASASDPARFARLYASFLDAMEAGGYHPVLGLQLSAMLRDAGLRDVRTQGWTGEWTGAGDNPSVFLRTFQKVRPRAVSEGHVTDQDADWLLEEIQTPSFRAITATHYCAWVVFPDDHVSARARDLGLVPCTC
jgi:ubiquinone/menaquinone biosynthesis C-methylase UbiE